MVNVFNICVRTDSLTLTQLDDVIKWKRFPPYWPFVWGIHWSPVNSPHKGPVTRSFFIFFDLPQNKRLSKQSRRGDLRNRRARYDVIVMILVIYATVTFTRWLSVTCFNSIYTMYSSRLWKSWWDIVNRRKISEMHGRRSCIRRFSWWLSLEKHELKVSTP